MGKRKIDISLRNINGKWKFHSLFLTKPRVNSMVSRQLIFQIHKVQEKKFKIAIFAGKTKVLLFKPRLFLIKITVIFGDLYLC